MYLFQDNDIEKVCAFKHKRFKSPIGTMNALILELFYRLNAEICNRDLLLRTMRINNIDNINEFYRTKEDELKKLVRINRYIYNFGYNFRDRNDSRRIHVEHFRNRNMERVSVKKGLMSSDIFSQKHIREEYNE